MIDIIMLGYGIYIIDKVCEFFVQICKINFNFYVLFGKYLIV